MSSRTDIDPLSITDGKISNQAKIKATKLAPASEGQVLIAGTDGKFRPGDLPITSTTTTTVVSASEDPLPRDSIKIGNGIIKDGYIKISDSEPNSIPIRDGHGVLKADLVVGDVKGTVSQADNAATADSATTATTATNADKLDNQEGSHYLDVDNHVYPDQTTTTDNNNETVTTKRIHEVVESVPTTSYGSSNYPIEFQHLMPYIPDVSVFILENNEYHEIDAKVKATAASGNTAGTVKVDVTEQNLNLKVIAN